LLSSSAVGAGDAAASPRKKFGNKSDDILANLVRFRQNGGEIWATVIRFEQWSKIKILY